MMKLCELCDKEIFEVQGSITDTKGRSYHANCLRAVLSGFERWGIDMLRHFMSTIKAVA